MRPDEKRDTIQLAASPPLREALSLPSAPELGIMATAKQAARSAGCVIGMVDVLSLIAEVQGFCSAAVASVEISGYLAHLLLKVLELAAPLGVFTVLLYLVFLDIV